MDKTQRSKWQISGAFIGAVVLCSLDIVETILQMKLAHQSILISRPELIRLLVKDSFLGLFFGSVWTSSHLSLASQQRLKSLEKLAITIAGLCILALCIWCIAFFWFHIYIK